MFKRGLKGRGDEVESPEDFEKHGSVGVHKGNPEKKKWG